MAFLLDYSTIMNPLRWFRHSSSYINSHRSKTFVILLTGEAIGDPNFATLIADITLLHSLGIRLVLVHGARPQIDTALFNAKITSEFHRHTRITTKNSLPIVLNAISSTRLRLESQFYQDSHTKICTISGNFISAKPLGIHDGIDYELTGEVRRVDGCAITHNLDHHHLVIISPLGFSATGEIFNLAVYDVATQVAIALQADKLIVFGDNDGIYQNGQLIREMTSDQATIHLSDSHNRELANVLAACQHGVGRVHLLNYQKDGAILEELFTTDGAGTMISQTPYEVIRRANVCDIMGMIELITPLQEAGILITRSRQHLEQDIECFYVIERDGQILGCAALYLLEDDSAEIASIAIAPHYRRGNRGVDLLRFIEKTAKKLGKHRLFALTTRTAHWFLEQGFSQTTPDSLPATRLAKYHNGRNSKVLVKAL